MSYVKYISFPRKLDISYATTEEVHVGFSGIEIATFDGCFKNPFVYELYVASHPARYYHIMNIDENLSEDKRRQEVERIWSAEMAWQQKNQYDIFYKNLNIGEFVELYTAWLNGNDYSFGPPLSEHSMTLEDFLVMQAPKYGAKRHEHELTKYGRKLTIHKTK